MPSWKKCVPLALALTLVQALGHAGEVLQLSDEVIPFKSVDEIPKRPKLLLEAGDAFLGTGRLYEGFEVPLLGSTVQPRLWSYVIYRTALQTFDAGAQETETEWSHRLDFFVNLQLTGTEKILLGLRPVDKNSLDRFTHYTFEGRNEGFANEFNLDIDTLFFEGDVGSLFPSLDPRGLSPIDLGFTIGRQPITFQEGILINDTLDAVGLIRNNLPIPGTSNFRISALWSWDRLNRNDQRSRADPMLFGVFTAADFHTSTVNVDFIYVNEDLDDGDGVYLGIAAIQRFGLITTAFRVNTSVALDKAIPGVIDDGTLLSAEFSMHPSGTDDILYLNPFVAIDNYTQAGREPILGGPLAALGILFASPNLSNYGAELNPFANEVVGFAAGYQSFWDNNRRNLVLEIAGRKDTSGSDSDDLSLGFQLQQAIGQHYQAQIEAFYTFQEDRRDASGARVELLVTY